MTSQIQNELTENNNLNQPTPTLNKALNVDDTAHKKPFFLMTLEDNLGKCKQIKIYQNSNPSELAFNFCKENNLDFSSMKYIKANIKNIVKKFKEQKQKLLFNINGNNSIKEEDEEDYLTEGTMRSNEKGKNKENDDENNLKESKSQDLEQNNEDKNNDISFVNIKNEQNDDNEQKDNEQNNNNVNSVEVARNNENNYRTVEGNNDDDAINNISDKYNLNNKAINKSLKTIENNDNKSYKYFDIESKSLEINPNSRRKNNFTKMPLKINPLSPKQIEINENVQKIKINAFQNNSNKSININTDGSTNNVFSLNSETQNNQNRANYGFINTTDRYSNSAHISIPDKEVSISQKIKKNKNSDSKQNNLIDSPFTFSNVSTNKKGSNKRVIDIDVESIDNSNLENNNNFDYNYFGEKYINFNKNNGKENIARNNDRNSINQYEDESMENGVPVLNKDNYYNTNSEPIKTTLSLHKNKMIVNNNVIVENQNVIETSNYGNKINKDLLLNKMRKCEITLPKRNTGTCKDINKLYKLIKNSCYNLNKLSHNKYNKNDNNINTNLAKMSNMKIKEINSLDINNEVSRNMDTDPSGLYTKEFFNNVYLNEENSKVSKKIISTNFNNYIENNKINTLRNNIAYNTQNNELTPQNNYNNSIKKHYFFSNPNLSSNQELLNKSNKIYNNKHALRYYQLNNKATPKSKSLGREKNKEKKKKSLSKNKLKVTKKDINIKLKIKELLKEKTKRFSFPFKNRHYLTNKSATPNINEEKKGKYWSLKSCQTPPIKNYLYSQYYLDSIFSEWILSTIGNNISRNIISKRDNYFHKKNENNQASKSVSELVDTNLKKSNYRMLLSRSNFKKKKTNIIAKKIKNTMKNKTSKENDFHNKKVLRSLKIINNSDSLRHKSLINKKNNINIIKHNESNIISKKSTDRTGVERRKTGKIINNNILNNHNSNNNKANNSLNIINDYNFNNSNYINRLIKNTMHSFVYDSTDNSKSGDKFRKIIQKQLTSPPNLINHSKDNNSSKSKKISCDKIFEYKNCKHKMDKQMTISGYGIPNQSIANESSSNNINHNISINYMINNSKNKNYNINYYNNGNNHYIKNSGLKKRKNIKALNNVSNNNDKKKKMINFSNELASFYLNTEMNKNNYNNNMTYSNLINNCLELKNLELSANEKISDEIIINILNKLFLFFNKEKTSTINLKDSFYKKRINFFDKNIRKILNNMIEILCKNYRIKKIYNKQSINSNRYRPNTTKNNNSNIVIMDKNYFINEMLYIYKHYLNSEYKKIIISHKNDIYKVIQDNSFDKTFCQVNKINSFKNDYLSPKTNQKKFQNKIFTEIKNRKNKYD